MIEKIISELLVHGKEITFAIVLIIFMFIFYKVVMKLLTMMQEKDENMCLMTEEVSALRLSLDNITSFLSGLMKGREVSK